MPRPTYLEQYAKKRGVTHINGLRMLILQALEAQKIWLGTAVMDEKEVDNILYMINQ
jgi:shikimate 5-dehydrogenase